MSGDSRAGSARVRGTGATPRRLTGLAGGGQLQRCDLFAQDVRVFGQAGQGMRLRHTAESS